jgi:hypothetical protein
MLDDAVDCKIILVAAGSEWRPFLDSVPDFDGRWILTIALLIKACRV